MNEFLAKFRDQYPQYADMPDADLLSALHAKFYSDLSREDFDAKVGAASTVAQVQAAGGPSIGPAGPTAQPAFAKLPPMAGGALDFLIQFGLQGGTFGAAGALFPAIAEQSAEIQARNPRMSTAMKGAGAAMAIPMAAGAAAVGTGLGGAALATARSRAATALGGGIGGGLLTRWLLSRQ